MEHGFEPDNVDYDNGNPKQRGYRSTPMAPFRRDALRESPATAPAGPPWLMLLTLWLVLSATWFTAAYRWMHLDDPMAALPG